MTAVEYLIEQLRQLAHNPNTHLGMGDIRVTQGYINELEEQAIIMEKEQMADAWYAGDEDGPIHDFEDYYNETFKK